MTQQPSRAVTINLPKPPPSANNLFPTGRNRRRYRSNDYEAWLFEAGSALERQKPPELIGPVRLDYKFKRGRIDLGNLEKATTDLLVKHGVIQGDSPKFVGDIRLRFADVPGLEITITQGGDE
jgi:Holliday junction resolvase RusA-like endonuclease